MTIRRETLAWAIVIALAAACCVLGITYIQSSSTVSTLRKALMEVTDTYDYRAHALANSQVTAGSALGRNGTASVDGNDAIGQINLNAGPNPAAGDLVHLTFKAPYPVKGTQPFVFIMPIDQPPVNGWYATIDWNGFDILASTPPKPNTNYAFAYMVTSRPWTYYISPSDPTGNNPPATGSGS